MQTIATLCNVLVSLHRLHIFNEAVLTNGIVIDFNVRGSMKNLPSSPPRRNLTHTGTQSRNF